MLEPRYKLYVSDVSYYSGKLEAFLRYRQIAHERIEVSTKLMREVLLPATGFMKVPAMQCPDGRWLKDTTPMMQWLDAEHIGPSIYPADAAQRFIALLLEDYADEWLWRPAMYYRWRFADSHRLLRHRLGHELSKGTAHPASLLGWFMRWRQYLVFVRGDGVRPHNEGEVQALYARTLAQLTALLGGRRFLMGARPGIVDFAFFASMFRHFALDPYSAKIMVDSAPAVYAWVARLWNARADDLVAADAVEGFENPAFDPLFAELASDYLPYLEANADAYVKGRKRFDLSLPRARYASLPVVRYRVACRQQLLTAYRTLAPAQRQQVDDRLTAFSSIRQWLHGAPEIDAGLSQEFEMPLAQHYPKARGWYGTKLYLGTPWDLPASASKER